MKSEDLKQVRFRQRLQNFEEAVLFLNESIHAQAPQRIKDTAVIKAYEMAFELSWKTLKDFLGYQGFLDATSPREVLKESFRQGYLEDGTIWIKMLDERNQLSHVYNQEISSISANAIRNRYVEELKILLRFLKSK